MTIPKPLLAKPAIEPIDDIFPPSAEEIPSKTLPFYSGAEIVNTTCAYCGVGCGIEIKREADSTLSLLGAESHPANFGKLCLKGKELLSTVGLENRLLEPQVNNQPVTWTKAIDEVSRGLQACIEKNGPDAVAFYVSGQLLTEDYYLANKLMKGYIGSANIDTNSRLCMSSAVSAYQRAFGEDVVPCDYDDIEATNLMVLVGSNAAWTHPVLFQRMLKARQLNPAYRIVVIDPRTTETAKQADYHLPLKPGSDAVLFLGLLAYIADMGRADKNFIAKATQGYKATLKEAYQWTPEAVAETCELSLSLVLQFYQDFTSTERALSFYSMGVNQSLRGVDNCSAFINVHLASGKILKPGCGPFSITGQPNAMGGREVGGLATQLAAHLDIHAPDDRALLQNFWQSPKMANRPGLKAVDLFKQIKQGKIKAIWIMATNPLVSLPNRREVEAALKACPLVIVSECVAENDTLQYAHIKLPATTWGEKDGTVTNSERRISRQRGFLKSPGQAKHDWQIIQAVARAMGFMDFNYENNHEVFTEFAKLTAFKNDGTRLLNLSGLTRLSREGYDRLRPQQWPQDTAGISARMVFADWKFSTESRLANFIPISISNPATRQNGLYPFILNSGRSRDQWHTMTRSARSPTLRQHRSKATISLNPMDADQLGIQQGEYIRITTQFGHCILPAELTEAIKLGECFVPIHWNKQWSSSAGIAECYGSFVDPTSGQPAYKQGRARLEKQVFSTYCQFLIKHHESDRFDEVLKNGTTIITSAPDFWLIQELGQSRSYELHFSEAADPDDLLEYLRHRVTKVYGTDINWQTIKSQKTSALLAFRNNQALALLRVSDSALNDCVKSFDQVLTENQNWSQEHFWQMLQQNWNSITDGNKVICHCWQVSETAIKNSIQNDGLTTFAQVSGQLKCGTGCGSCRQEVSDFIASLVGKSQNELTAVEEFF